MSIGNFLESLSQAILVGMMLVGRLGVKQGRAAQALARYIYTCIILLVSEIRACFELDQNAPNVPLP